MKNVLKHFWITLTRFRIASTLNILGLSVAFAVFILLISQAWWNLSFNHSVPNHERIFRALGSVNPTEYWPSIARPIGEKIGESSAAIESFGGMGSFADASYSLLGSEAEIAYGTFHATDDLPATFSLTCLSGSFDDFNAPNTIILPEPFSEMLFGNISPIGQLISNGTDTLRVVAVYEPLASNTRINSHAIVNMGMENIANYGQWDVSFYYKFKEGVDHSATTTELENFGSNFIRETLQMESLTHDIIRIEPLDEEYFSPLFPMGGDITITLILIFIAAIILSLAIINYLNFFMSLVPIRVRAVNINKVFGAPVAALRANIIFEALLFMVLGYGLSLLWIQLASNSYIADLFTTYISLEAILPIVLVTCAVVVTLGIIVGLLPAFYITKFSPTLVLKGSFGRSKSGRALRVTLSGIQFVVSFTFAVVAIFIILQNRYLKEFDYGFQRDRVALLSLHNSGVDLDTFGKELQKNPMVEGVSFMMTSVISNFPSMSYIEDPNGNRSKYVHLYSDPNILNVLGIEIIEGEGFREGMGSDKLVINSAMRDAFDLEVGDIINRTDMEVIGIIGNVHGSSLKGAIVPLAFITSSPQHKELLTQAHIRLSSDANFAEVQDYISETLQRLGANPVALDRTMTPLNTQIENMYGSEESNEELITLFSLITFIISLMGVFGMVLFDMQYRHREIALRKVYGSSVVALLLRFNRSVLITLSVSFIVAVPLAIWGLEWWLESFSYRVPLYSWVFIAAFITITLLVVTIVSIQCLSVANRNPVKSLKSE